MRVTSIAPLQYSQYFVVDCEAPTTSPVTGPLVEFAVVHLTTDHSFHGRLWDHVPAQENPAIPVPVAPNLSISWTNPLAAGKRPVADETSVFAELTNWLHQIESDRPIFVSDNPAFDWQWIAAGYACAGLPSPFGYSGRRIGDFGAGTARDWQASSAWKDLRRTAHTHDPLDDARGNAEALRALLGLDEPQGAP